MLEIQKPNNRGFTILELMISMTLFALIITSVIIAVGNLSVTRIKTLNRVALLEELYFFSEQLFTEIKDGGTLDYEEYWNREAVGTGILNGHYTVLTGLGNYGKDAVIPGADYGSGIYLCRSNNMTNMGTGGCLTSNNNGASGYSSGSAVTFNGAPQRYGQYLAQFTDYNGNGDIDLGNEDGDASGNIVGDDDDKSTGDVPGVSTGAMQELYLINKAGKRRNFFRWNIKADPNSPIPGCIIDTTTIPGKILTGTGCLGNIQILKLKGLDVGLSHSGLIIDKTAYDGVVDTWVCAENDQCTGPNVFTGATLATGQDQEWIDIFPSTINVKNISFQIFPIKDPWLSWSAPDCSVPTCVSPFIHPYVRMNLEMGFAWGKRRALRNEDPTISISTSVSLSDFE